MLESYALGRTGLDARRRLMDTHAAYLRELVERARPHHGELRTLSDAEAVGIVAGLTELTLRASLDEQPLDGAAHMAATVDFLTAMLSRR